MSVLQPSVFFILAVITLAIAEYVWRLRSGRGYDLAALSGTVGTWVGQALMRGLTAGAIGTVMLFAFSVAPVQWPVADWRVWLIGFFLVEFVLYWQHRFSHTIRWFWASHAVHHSPNEFTLPAAIRLSWTGGLTGNWLIYVPLVLIGFHPLVVFTLLATNLQYQYFIHTEAVRQLGPLEWVLNTPSHHRVHHGSNPDYLDKNFGGVLIVFDRLFGTFAPERADEPVVYGLTAPLTSNNPFVIAFHEWGNLLRDLRSSRSLRSALVALFGRPGAGAPTLQTFDRPPSPLLSVETQGSGQVPPTSTGA